MLETIEIDRDDSDEKTLGYGLQSEVPEELMEIMKKNSEALEEMKSTSKAPCSSSQIQTGDSDLKRTDATDVER